MGAERLADGGGGAGEEDLHIVSRGFLDHAHHGVGAGRIEERDRGEVDDERLVRSPMRVEHRADGRGGAEEERAGDAIDDDVADRRQARRQCAARPACRARSSGTNGGCASTAVVFGHAVDEQHGAEGEADHDGLGQVAEDGQQEGRQQHQRVAPRRAQQDPRWPCFSTMFQATTASTPASAASGM